MKCLIPNSCEDKQLCCAFCKKKEVLRTVPR